MEEKDNDILKVGMPKRVSSEDFEEIKKSDLQLPKYSGSYENLDLDLFMGRIGRISFNCNSERAVQETRAVLYGITALYGIRATSLYLVSCSY